MLDIYRVAEATRIISLKMRIKVLEAALQLARAGAGDALDISAKGPLPSKAVEAGE
jgi:hypothetical protein